MSKISNILSEIGVSKVRLAKYLGVSRQMLYNYLALEKLEDWPSEKATRLMQLLEIKREEDLNNIQVDGEYIIKIDTKLNDANISLGNIKYGLGNCGNGTEGAKYKNIIFTNGLNLETILRRLFLRTFH